MADPKSRSLQQKHLPGAWISNNSLVPEMMVELCQFDFQRMISIACLSCCSPLSCEFSKSMFLKSLALPLCKCIQLAMWVEMNNEENNEQEDNWQSLWKLWLTRTKRMRTILEGLCSLPAEAEGSHITASFPLWKHVVWNWKWSFLQTSPAETALSALQEKSTLRTL